MTFIKVPTDISGFFWLKRMPADSYEYRLSASLSSQIFFIYQSFSMRNGKSVEAIRQFFLDYGEIDFAFAITDDNRYLLIKFTWAAKASRSLLHSASIGAKQMSTGHLAPAQARYSGITIKGIVSSKMHEYYAFHTENSTHEFNSLS